MPLKRRKRKIIRKKRVVKKIAKKKAVKKNKPRKPAVRKSLKKSAQPKEKGKIVGKITHYFPHVMAAVIKLKAPLAVGDNIKIKGHTTDFTQNISSLQIDHLPINTAKKGDEIGLLVSSRVRQHDTVYKI